MIKPTMNSKYIVSGIVLGAVVMMVTAAFVPILEASAYSYNDQYNYQYQNNWGVNQWSSYGGINAQGFQGNSQDSGGSNTCQIGCNQ